MKKIRLRPAAIAAIVAVGAGIAALLYWRSAPHPEARPAASAAPRPALTVTVTQPRTQSVPIRLAANGNIAAWQEASIGTETQGLRLVQVNVNVGDRVTRGQALATLAAETLGAEAAQSRASLAEAEASAADAANNAQRARSLEGTGALSASQINQYFTAEKTAQAKVEAARALLRQQEARLGQTSIVAPDDGIISARTATVGAVLGPGTELFRLIRQGRLEWRAEVTSTELGRIAPGTPAQVTAASGARLTGKVRMIAPTVDPQTRAALVYVDITPVPGAPASARAGMFARGEFDLGSSSALTVPQAALVVREGFNYVFRVGAENRVSQVKITTGRLTGDRVEVTAGLTPDARIVAAGAGFLNDGDVVRIAESGAGAGK